MAKPKIYEDGTNVAAGTEFFAVGSKVLPWYDPLEGKAPVNWPEKWTKLRSRFEKLIDEYCKLECFLIQRRIPASEGWREQPFFLNGRQILRVCNGIRLEPSKLFATDQNELVGLFPFDNVRKEPMLDEQGRPVAFRLGLSHQFIVSAEDGWEFTGRPRPIPELIDLARDGTHLIYQLPSEIASSLWRNLPFGFSRTQNADDSLWFDALFQLSLQQTPGGPLYSKRYDWHDNSSIGLMGDGLFPWLPDFAASNNSADISHRDNYPMAYYAKLPDLARASVAAIDEILERNSALASPSTKRFRISLSFPGERREFVEKVALNLAARLQRERVLYDRFYEAEFAQPDLDVYLPNLYRTECDLIAVFLCADYAKKRWCKLEWRSIKQLIQTAESSRIMLLSFDDIGALHDLGILDGDGYVSIGQRLPEQITKLIEQRLEHLAKQTTKVSTV